MATVILGARAKRQVQAAERWCKEHGPPISIPDAIAWLIDHLETNPEMWPIAENARRPGLRRAYLPRIDYHVYYRFDRPRDVVKITDIRHARRHPIQT